MLGQRRELSIRLALGGGRTRIIALLVMEAGTLSLLGAVAGVLVANWLFPLLMYATGNAAFALDLTSWNVSWRALGVMAVLAVVTSGAIVIVPAVRLLRTDLYAGLKDGGAALGESRALARVRSTFVVLQTAFAIVLLCGAGLMVRTFHNLGKVDLGFDPVGKLKVQLAFPPDTPIEIEPRLARLREIEAALRRVPGVRAVGFGNDILLPGYTGTDTEVFGPEGKRVKLCVRSFGQGFEQAAGLRLLRGQWLTHKQGDHVLVNESLARAFWPGKDPVGQFLRKVDLGPAKPGEWAGWYVEGVVADVHSNVREAPIYTIYGPETWGPFNFTTFIIQLSRPNDVALVGAVRRELYAFDPQLVVAQAMSLLDVRNMTLSTERMVDSVLSVLSGIAVVLTVIGLFSVLAYTVDRRMAEFGVRMALGATRRDVMSLVVRRGVMLAVIGLVIGIGSALALSRYLQSLLYQTSAHDPVTLAAVTVVLLITAFLACALPAYRATKADVARLLRAE
jgi:putative ABC transport system permease protein